MRALDALVRYARRPQAEARCELCAAPLAEEHAHVVDVEDRRLCCTCAACAATFAQPAAGARFRASGRRVLFDAQTELSAAEWALLGVPVTLAFVFVSSKGPVYAAYPSPAGATESLVEDDAWARFRATRPLAQALEPDIEALLVSGEASEQRLRHLLVPIDVCYDLVGRVRSSFKGVGGAHAARDVVDELFASLSARAKPLHPNPDRAVPDRATQPSRGAP